MTCVLCQAFNKGSTEECAGCSLNIRFVNDTISNCVYDDDGCLTVFNFEENFGTGNETVLVVKERSKYATVNISLSNIQGISFFSARPFKTYE